MKKFTVILLLIVFCGGYAMAYDFSAVCESGQTLYYNITSNVEPYTVKVCSENTGGVYSIYPTGDLEIPETVEYNSITYSVTSIETAAFSGCSGLTSVTIPNSVTSIGERAFENIYGLSVYYTGTIEQWCEITFSFFSFDCYNLYINGNLITDLVIPSNITEIKSYTFLGALSLTSVTISHSVTSIGVGAFYGCSGLTSVTIPNSVTSIRNAAFNQVKNIVYNGTATGSPWGALTVNGFVDDYLVYSDETKTNLTGCSTLATNVTIPNSVTTIGDNAFSGCSSLTSVTIPNSVTNIGNSAFSGCSGLTLVTIPNSVTSIRERAFLNCSGLTSITIPNSVTSIGVYAFSGCSGLTSVTIPNSVTSIGSGAFNRVKNIVYNGTATGSPWGALTVNGYIEGYFVYLDETKTNLTGCSSLATEITIPNSVTSIGKSAFSGCSRLTSMTIPFVGNSATASTLSASSLFGYVFGEESYDGGIPVRQWDPFGYTQIRYYIPGSLRTVNVIGGNLGGFMNCSMLTSVTIGSGVTSIGDYAFHRCSGLTSVTIPHSVTSIGDHAFDYCTGLVGSLIIPDSVTSIGLDAFWGCSGLSGPLTIPNSVTIIGEGAFAYCSGLTTVTIGNGVTSIGFEAFDNCSSLAEITIGESVDTISDYAFYGCSRLTTLNLNATNCKYMGSLYSSCFMDNCTSLTTLNIGDNVTNIPNCAFYNCKSISEIYTYAITPPTLGTGGIYDFSSEVFSNAIVWTPCQCVNSYRNANGWNRFTNISNDTAVNIIVEAQAYDETMGNVTGDGRYSCGADVVLTAIPNTCYCFRNWSNGSTENPLHVIVNGDASYVAYFELLQKAEIISDETSFCSFTGQLNALPIERVEGNWSSSSPDIVSFDEPSNPNTVVHVDTSNNVSSDYAYTIYWSVNNDGCLSNDSIDITFGVIQTYTIDTTVNNYIQFGGHTYYVNGTYEFEMDSDEDCPSVVILNLNVRNDVGEYDADDIRCFPNPTNGKLNIRSDRFISFAEFYSVTGQLVMRKEVNGYESECNIEGLVDGVYVLRIYGEESSLPSLYKIVKE